MPNESLSFYSRHLNVLYVEDEAPVREAATRLLSMYFKHVDAAANGKEAYDKYDPALHHMVITDINMPVMNGLELIQRVRAKNPSQLIVVTSAHNEADYLCNLISLGVDFFLMKPFESELFVSTLTRACSKLFHEKRYTYMRQVIQENGGLSTANANLNNAIEALNHMLTKEELDVDKLSQSIDDLRFTQGTMDYISQLFAENAN